jgi:uncharacterized protein YdhG (YjbR/CyaY superfamily)
MDAGVAVLARALTGAGWETRRMPRDEIDAYLASLEAPARGTLEELRRTILKVVPDAEEGLSYGVPAFRVRGKAVAGFAAFKNHLTYVPHSGSVLGDLGDDVAGYETSKGSLKFAIDTPLPEDLVTKLVAARLRELDTD